MSVCSAIDQHELEQISPDPKDTSFKHAIRDADRLESKTMPYTRNWYCSIHEAVTYLRLA